MDKIHRVNVRVEDRNPYFDWAAKVFEPLAGGSTHVLMPSPEYDEMLSYIHRLERKVYDLELRDDPSPLEERVGDLETELDEMADQLDRLQDSNGILNCELLDAVAGDAETLWERVRHLEEEVLAISGAIGNLPSR